MFLTDFNRMIRCFFLLLIFLPCVFAVGCDRVVEQQAQAVEPQGPQVPEYSRTPSLNIWPGKGEK